MLAADAHLTKGESTTIGQDEGLHIDLVVTLPTVVAPRRNSGCIYCAVTHLIHRIIVRALIVKLIQILAGHGSQIFKRNEAIGRLARAVVLAERFDSVMDHQQLCHLACSERVQ